MVNKYHIIYTFLIIGILLQNLFFHMINPSSITTLLLIIDIIVIFLISLNLRKYNYTCIFGKKYIFAIMLFILLPQTIYTFLQGQTVSDYIDVVRPVLSILLILPLLKLFMYDRKLDRVLNMVQLFTIISLILILANSYMLNEYGTSLFPFDYYQMPEFGRNGRLRIYLISDFLSFVAIYSFANVIKKNRRIYNLIVFVIAVVTEAYVEQTRMILIAIAVSCLFMFSISIKKRRWKSILYILTIAMLLYGFIADWYSDWFAIFSISNSMYGLSTISRIIEILYVPKLLSAHPFLGTGMMKDYIIPISFNGINTDFNHTDIGILGTATYIGIYGAVIIFIWPLVRCIKTIMRFAQHNKTCRDCIFASGLVVYITVTSLTIVITDNARIFAWPFVLAVIEFCRYKYAYDFEEISE